MPGPLWKVTHTQSGRKWRRSFRVNATNQQLWPRLPFCTLRVPTWPPGKWPPHWRPQREAEGIDVDNCHYDNSTASLNLCLFLNHNAVRRTNSHCGIWEKGKSILVLTKQREKFSFDSTPEIKDSISAAAAATDSVNSCGSLIWYDRRDSHSYTCVETYTSKYHDMCPILSLISLCCFFQHSQRPALDLTDIFSEDVTPLGD